MVRDIRISLRGHFIAVSVKLWITYKRALRFLHQGIHFTRHHAATQIQVVVVRHRGRCCRIAWLKELMCFKRCKKEKTLRKLWKTIVNHRSSLLRHQMGLNMDKMQDLPRWEAPHLKWQRLPNPACSVNHLLSARRTLRLRLARADPGPTSIKTKENPTELLDAPAIYNLSRETVVLQTLKSAIISPQRKRNSKFTRTIRSRTVRSAIHVFKLRKQRAR